MVTLVKKYIYILRQSITIVPIIIGYIFSKFKKDSNVWIFLERGYDAQDNAWILYNYMLKQYPEVEARFAIKHNTLTYRSLRDKKMVLNYGSIKYYMFLYNARYIISTHVGTHFSSSWISGKLRNTRLYPNAKYVFLQHGIIHNNILGLHYNQLCHPIDLFICGALKEYDFISSNYNYPKDVVKYTGLARFDRLHSFKRRKQILIMPTWRKKYATLNLEEFEKTDYYISYSKVLSNQTLYNILSYNDYTLLFYNHFEFQKYNALFEQYTNDRIHLVQIGEISVQEMLKSSALLVTDYSSVYYDFIYMEKPVVFFLLNREEFYGQQYGDDLDDPGDFGIVVNSSESLIAVLTDYIKSDCTMESKYYDNMRTIFTLRDANNCSRIVSEILNIK